MLPNLSNLQLKSITQFINSNTRNALAQNYANYVENVLVLKQINEKLLTKNIKLIVIISSLLPNFK